MKFKFLCTFLLLAASAATYEGSRAHKARHDFKAQGPYNGAHRGASGEYPESSVAAFKRAIQNGASIIETDIGATKDGKLICLHDTTLDAITDVADRAQFSSRRATYLDQGINVTGFFAVDFTLAELKTLRLKQRFPFRDRSYDGMFEIATFEEYLSVARSSHRVVAIDPEIKNPVFINSHIRWSDGKLFEDVFVDTLIKYGYKGSYLSSDWLRQPVFIQTFALSSILRIANKTSSPKIFNLGAPSDIAQDTGRPYSEYYTDANFDYLSGYVAGLSTFKNLIVPLDSNNRLLPASDFVDRAHARGLLVQTAIFSNDRSQQMAMEFVSDPYQEYEYFVQEIQADIILTDHPRTLATYLKSKHGNKQGMDE